MSSRVSHPVVPFLRARLEPLAHRANAKAMAAYMKTDMPFFGIKKPDREPHIREAIRTFSPATRSDYQRTVIALWNEPEREMKYAAVRLARAHDEFIVMPSIPLYRRLIVEGAWWDFVDEVADHLVGRVVLLDRARAAPIMRRWIDDEKRIWLRRSAILCQLKHKRATDEGMLFDFCLRRAHETEFFIRKAIGWALRQYAYTNPAAVNVFLKRNRERFSGLTLREAGKHLDLRA